MATRRGLAASAMAMEAEARERALLAAEEGPKLKALRAEVRHLRDELVRTKHSCHAYRSMVEDVQSPHRIRKRKAGRDTRLVSCSVLSDLHVDEIVEPEVVNGLNTFNPDIADARLDYYWNSIVSLLKKEQTHAVIDTHILAILGDLWSGHIHDDLVETAARAPKETFLWLKPRLEAGIEYLAETLKVKELVIPWCYGNHARDGKKPRVSTAAQHNDEWLLGSVLRDQYHGQTFGGTKVTFLCDMAYMTYVDIPCPGQPDFRLAFHHGDAVKSSRGAAMETAILAWNQSVHADLYVNGHLHFVRDDDHHVQNGSLIGYNAFAKNVVKAPFSPPQQVMFLVDVARRRKTGTLRVHVEPKPS